MIGTPRREDRVTWWVVAGLLVAMSADEAVQIHERLRDFLAALVGIDVPWVVPALVMLAVVLFATRAIWRALDRRDLARLAVAGTVYVGGAARVEAIWLSIHRRISPGVSQTIMHIEETMEMAGLVLLCRAALLIVARAGSVTVDVHASARERSGAG